MSRGLWFGAFPLGAIGVALAGCSADGETASVDCDRVPDLRSSWQHAQSADDEDGRRAVAAYITDCGALRGRSRTTVRRVLGQPVEAHRREMWFYLGPDGLNLDSENLVIQFGTDGTVTRAEVAQG
jgi:hypothetical protein